MTRFIKGATTLQFNQDPLLPATAASVLRQLHERDSSGADYVYQKSTLRRSRYRLVFARLTDAVHASLRSFLKDDVDGVRSSFTWYDHADTARTVRVAQPGFTAVNIGPDQWRVVIDLTEDVIA